MGLLCWVCPQGDSLVASLAQNDNEQRARDGSMNMFYTTPALGYLNQMQNPQSRVRESETSSECR